jgi:hypothetical protein
MNPTISIKESLISTGIYLPENTEVPAKRALYQIIVGKQRKTKRLQF